jgi:oligosaccharide repeat unit polymerase
MQITHLNWISFNYYFGVILQSLIGVVIIAMNLDSSEKLTNLISQDDRLLAWAAVVYGMIAIPIGILFIYRMFGVKTNLSTFAQKPLMPLIGKTDQSIRYALYFLGVICILSVLYSIWTSGGISMLRSAFQSAAATAEIRAEIGWHYSGIDFIRQVFALMLTPILSFIFFSYWRMTRQRSCFIWFIIMFLASLTVLTFSLAKSALSFYVIGYILLLVLIDGKTTRRFTAICVCLVMIFLIMMYAVSYREHDISSMFSIDNFNSSIVTRLIFGQIVGIYFSFFVFPSLHAHQGLLSQSGVISSLFGWEKELPYDLVMTQTISSSSVKGLGTSLYPAEAWALFGWPGLVFCPLLLGMAIGVISWMMFRFPKTPVHVGVYAYISYKLVITAGFMLFFYNPELIKTLIVLFVFVMIGVFLSPLKVRQPLRQDEASSRSI